MTVKDGINGWKIIDLQGLTRDNHGRMPNRIAIKLNHTTVAGNWWSIAADLDKKPGDLWLPPVGSDHMNQPLGFEQLPHALARAGLVNTHMHFPQPDSSVEAIAASSARAFEHYVRVDVCAPRSNGGLQSIMGALKSIKLEVPMADQIELQKSLLSLERQCS